ncbi:hypothetical protein ASZ90_010070 [hydrocarbon metagenome]|uniref:Uncharacterized protein n=1 Tax=hydrocarbon metagenome TaxID=938273 RepID=A0A0W8FH18_9ZZZZ
MSPTVHYTGTIKENRIRDIDIRSRIFIRCACSPFRGLHTRFI